MLSAKELPKRWRVPVMAADFLGTETFSLERFCVRYEDGGKSGACSAGKNPGHIEGGRFFVGLIDESRGGFDGSPGGGGC